MGNDYLTVTEAAQIAGCQRGYLYSIMADVFETRLVEGRRFISRKSFESWNRGYQLRRHTRPDVPPNGTLTQAVA